MNIPERINALRALMEKNLLMPISFLPMITIRVNMLGNILRQELLSQDLRVLPELQ